MLASQSATATLSLQATAELDGWCRRASALSAASTVAHGWRRLYHLGDGVLDVTSNCATLERELKDHYGECLVDTVPESVTARVRCRVQAIDEDLALMRFDEPASVDAFAAALALLKHPVDDPQFLEQARPIDDWQLIVEAATGTPVVAARGAELLVDWRRITARVYGQLVVNQVLAQQRGLLFAHAASVGVRDAGLMLVGPSGSGKTTSAMTLASRGHAYFGDDIAAIRYQTGELVAFRRTAHIRPGVHARTLERHVEEGQWDAPYRDGLPRLRLRVADVFPIAQRTSLPLRRVLFLRGFAAAPRIEPFKATAHAFSAASRFAFNNTLWVAWGTTPQSRLMQFMLFLRMLERVRCGWLDVGHPDATADLIEHTEEDT
jgi:hypothetical protein